MHNSLAMTRMFPDRLALSCDGHSPDTPLAEPLSSAAVCKLGRPGTAYMDADALGHNLRTIRHNWSRGARIMAMVKANAYGHDAIPVSRLLQAQGVDMLGVACLTEAQALRHAGITVPIVLAQGVYSLQELAYAMDHGYEVVVHTSHHLDWLGQLAGMQRPGKIWIKIDTGMGRLGIDAAHVSQALAAIQEMPHIQKPVSVMTHLACADHKEHLLNGHQIQTFLETTRHHVGIRSLCNSAAMIHFPDHTLDVIRPGLALYGASPLPGTTGTDIGLKPVMQVVSRLMAVKIKAAGSAIGYASRYVCPVHMPVGLLAFGYADGYPLSASVDSSPNVQPFSQTSSPCTNPPCTTHWPPTAYGVTECGARCPVIGRVAMDMLALDLRSCPTSQPGDPITLWGASAPIEHLAHVSHTHPWEIMTRLGTRIQRIWSS